MREDTKDFCETGAPFRAVHREFSGALAPWAVRDVTGFAVADCEDEDAALAIAEALNAGAKQTPGKAES